MSKYSTRRRKAIAEAFRNAKPYLWDGVTSPLFQEEFICFAIHRANGKNLDSLEVAKTACKIIRARMGDYGNIRTWLRDEAKIPHRKLSKRAVQSYRHRWLDSLIAEFSTTEQP